jgi:hypothetical protein
MGTGGMRCGAGRPGYRAKAEQLQRVDIRIWRWGGYLSAGRSFSWSWNRGGEPTGSIGVLVDDAHSLALRYMIGEEGQRRDGSQTVRIAYTACHYGNTRPWFVCPVCHRRAGLLFMRWARFACRHCQRVAYSSQSDDELDRLWRMQATIERRLGKNWQRPKGMRHRTYDRLMAALCDCEERRDEAFAVAASRLLGLLRDRTRATQGGGGMESL